MTDNYEITQIKRIMRTQIFTQICFLLLFPGILLSQDVIVTQNTNVTIESGWKMKLTNGGDLIIKDDVSGTGSLIDRNSNSQVTFTGTGEAKVQLFISEDEWHYISSPTAATLSGVFLDIYLMQFVEPDGLWSYITATDVLLNPFHGYAAWSSSSYSGNTTVLFNGNLNAGTYSANLSNSNNQLSNSNGFNFVGNPYPSAIDWMVGTSGWTRTNIDPTIYLWNPLAGQYGSYNRNTKISTNDIDSIIPSKQGFFVHVSSSGSGTLEVNSNAQLHNHKAFYKSGSKLSIPESLDLTVSGNGYQDEAIIFFNSNATSGIDSDYEAYKMQGKESAPQLYTSVADVKLAVNALEEITCDLTIPLYFKAGANGIYDITAENLESFEANQDILLEDLFDNILQDLKLNPLYTFSGTLEDDSARFVLHFNKLTVVDKTEQMATAHIYAYDKTVYINLPYETSGTIELFNLMGQSVYQGKVQSGLNQIKVNEKNKHFVVRITCNNGIKSQKVYIK